MINQEFKTQIFKTRAQWDSGLFYRLDTRNQKGITLFSMPTFANWIQGIDIIKEPAGLAIDECGQIYILDGATCHLYRYEPKTKLLENISCISGCGEKNENFKGPARIIIDTHTLWIFFKENKKVRGFSRTNYQLKYVIDKYFEGGKECHLKGPSDIGLDEVGNLYILDQELHRIFQYSKNGIFIKAIDLSYLKEPVGLAISNDAGFKITDQTIRNLRLECLPDDVLKDLESIKNKTFTGIKELLNILTEKIGKEQTIKYKLIILNHLCKENAIYIIDKEGDSFCKITQGEECKQVGDFNINNKQKICDTEKDRNKANNKKNYKPSIITIDQNGNVFVVFIVEKQTEIHQFDPDGSYIGEIQIPEFKGTIKVLATDRKGNLYSVSNNGIAYLSAQRRFTKSKGIYYSKTLDSGIKDCQWHRLKLNVELPPKTILEVYYYSSNESALKIRIDNALRNNEKSAQEKSDYLNNNFNPSWIGPEKFISDIENPTQNNITNSKDRNSLNGSIKDDKDMLFRKKTGRYLLLKLELSTFDENVRPVVKEMRCYYPRTSYLRYLPAVYQEDQLSSKFLERFLSIFETMFYDLETDITNLFTYFGSDTAPSRFLTWLSSWLNLALEEEWSEEKIRKFINEAPNLYKIKGTPSGIRRFIEIYTDKSPLIIETSITEKPMVLGEQFRLGVNSMVTKASIRGFRLGDSILGNVVLRHEVQLAEDPFLNMAHRFTVILPLSKEEFNRYEKGVDRILNEQKPAHTTYNLRVFKEMGVGLDTYVGISTRVDDYVPMQIKEDTILGTNLIVFDNTEACGKIERRSKLAIDTLLI